MITDPRRLTNSINQKGEKTHKSRKKNKLGLSRQRDKISGERTNNCQGKGRGEKSAKAEPNEGMQRREKLRKLRERAGPDVIGDDLDEREENSW